MTPATLNSRGRLARLRDRLVTLGRAFWLTMALVVLVKLLFLVSYPLNVSGDGATYYAMMRSRTSNLAHAGGYPFLVGLPLGMPRAVVGAVRDPVGTLAWFSGERRPAPETPPEPTPGAKRVRKSVRVPGLWVALVNHLIDALAIAALFLLLRAVFATGVAVFGALLYGLNPWNVQWGTLSRPEAVQSDLVVVAVATLYWAWRAQTPRAKRFRYVAALAVFALAVLVKPNAILLGTLPVAVLALDPSPWRERLRIGALAGGAAVAIVVLFVVLYHRPSTGTARLDYLSGHNLYERLRRNAVALYDPDNGPASKKLAILTRVLPPEPAACCGPTLFSHVAWVPPAERAPYRERWLPVLTTRDPALLERTWTAVRDRPAGKVTALHYYLGLGEANDLLRAVFFEAVRARPAPYLAGSWTRFRQAFSEPHEVLVPVPPGFADADPRIAVLDGFRLEPRGLGFVRFVGRGHESRMLGHAKGASLWLPGATGIAWWLAVTRVPTWVTWVVIGVGVVLALAGSAGGEGDPRASRWGPALVVATLLVFFAAWALVFDVRNKDMRLVQPLLEALVAVGVWKVWRLVRPTRSE